MSRRGRSLKFDDDELEDLADLPYGDKRVFPLLSLLYPFVDLRNEFHVDHVCPRSRFSTTALRRAGVPEDRLHQFKELAERLPNLQLLQGGINESKNAQLPNEWLRLEFPKENDRKTYIFQYDLEGLPDTVLEFDAFYQRRRAGLLAKMKALLGTKATT